MDVDRYFKHMEKVVYGTKFVNLEYENQFGGRYGSSGKGYQCPECKVGFNHSIPYKERKTTKTLECPCCRNVFNIT